jgi:hypothetical protein
VSGRVVRLHPAELARGAAPGTDWIWVVGAGIEPSPDALDRLLEAAATTPRPAVALCSLVVDSAGDPHRDYLPDGHRRRLPDLIEACERRLMPIRDAPFASLLLSAAALAAQAPPDPRYGAAADREFTARLLGVGDGYLVCDSLATATSASPARPAARARLLRSPAGSLEERARIAALAARDALAAVRAGGLPDRPH